MENKQQLIKIDQEISSSAQKAIELLSSSITPINNELIEKITILNANMAKYAEQANLITKIYTPALDAVKEAEKALTAFKINKSISDNFSKISELHSFISKYSEQTQKFHELYSISINDIKKSLNLKSLEETRIRYLGQKGEITDYLKNLNILPLEEKKPRAAVIQAVKKSFEAELAEKKEKLEEAELNAKLSAEAVDVTLPGIPVANGKIHPLTAAMEEIAESLKRLGFVHAYGPEVETDAYNFTKLNLPLHHPARQDQDTFYVQQMDEDGRRKVLRTQTSNVQIRALEALEPPFRVMGIGRVYRRDYDLTHTPQFHQVEGMMVQEGTTFANMVAVLEAFMSQFFGQQLKTRLRPHYFPFTEPSAEVDISCVFCKGSGCRVCKHTGWLEVLGCGMVHRNVLAVGDIGPGTSSNSINKKQISGFAFGAGVERLAMLKYGIGDLRLFYESFGGFLDHYGKPPVSAA